MPPLFRRYSGVKADRYGAFLKALVGSGAMVLFAWAAASLAWPDFVLDVQWFVQLAAEQRPTVYFGTHRQDFEPERSAQLYPGVSSDQRLPLHRARLSTRDPIHVIRLDLGTAKGLAHIGPLQLRTGAGAVTLSPEQMRLMAIRTQDMEWAREGSETDDLPDASVRLTGVDPYVVLTLPDGVRESGSAWREKAQRWLVNPWAPWLGVTLMGLGLLQPLVRSAPRIGQRLRRGSEALGRRTRIEFQPASLLILLAIPIGFLLYVGLNLHQSSIGAWYDQYGYPLHDAQAIWGEPQEIRSDEWMVNTPWLLHQVQTGMGVTNPNIGPPGAPLIAGVPVIHPTLLAQPQFWGFLMFDLDRGFSWLWGVRLFSLFGALFVLVLLLTQGRTLLSLGTTLAIIGSSQVQWWYASWLTENIVGLALALVGVHVWANSRHPVWMCGAAVMAALAGMHVVLQPYLPTVLSMAYLGALLMVAVLWKAGLAGELFRHTTQRLGAAVLGLVVFGILFWTYFDAARPAIEGVLNTVYPGSRKLAPGGEVWHQQLVGLFDFWRTKYETPLPTNPSESSRPLVLFPLLIFGAVTLGRRLHWPAEFWALVLYCLLAMLWMSAPLPAWLAQAMGSIGLNKVPAHRMYGGLCVASWCLAAVVFTRFAQERRADLFPTLGHVVLALLVVTAAWVWLRPDNPGYYTHWRLGVSLVVVGSLVWAVYRGQAGVFLVGVLLAIWMPMQVNPLSQGVGMMLDKELLHRTRVMDPEGEEIWAVMDGSPLSQLLRANGHTVITGTYFAPRFDLMQKFDPEQTEIGWWNNYGDLSLVASAEPGELTFRRQIREDLDAIHVHPCHPALRAAGVTRWVIFDAFPAVQADCLTRLAGFKPLGLQIYGRVSTAPGS